MTTYLPSIPNLFNPTLKANYLVDRGQLENCEKYWKFFCATPERGFHR